MNSSQTTVADIRQILEVAYPPYLAEKWDAVGLICGDPQAEVRKVAFALDCTQGVAERAVEMGADMLVIHHPLLMRGVNTVAADTPKGKVIHTLIRGGVALFAAHTNADSARPGVNDKLAELVGIKPGRPIVPKDPKVMDKWGVHVPADALAPVKQALFTAKLAPLGITPSAPSNGKVRASSPHARARTRIPEWSVSFIPARRCAWNLWRRHQGARRSSTSCEVPTLMKNLPLMLWKWPRPRT